MKKLFSIFIVMLAIGACTNKADKTLPLEDDPDAQFKKDIGDFNKDSFNTSLDILFVIDDSGSMGTHQDNLAKNIPQFTDEIFKTKFLDYHIGVISSTSYAGGFGGGTGACCGKLFGAPPPFGAPFGTPSNPVYVDRKTPNADVVLSQNLIVGTNGSASEMFFEPVQSAFSPTLLTGANAGFYRKNAYLAIIFITDTDDQSSIDPSSFWNFLVTMKGSADKIIIGAAYVPDAEFDTCQAEYDIQSLDKLPQLFKTAKALTFSLCDPNYGAKLAEISKFIVSKSRRKFLTDIPDPATINVTIGGIEIPKDFKKGWSYNAFYNSLEFGPDIEWENYPDDVYPEITYTTIPVSSIPE